MRRFMGIAFGPSQARSSSTAATLLIGLALGSAGCQRTPEPAGGAGAASAAVTAPALPTPPPPPSPSPAGEPAADEPLRVTWIDPAGFRRVTPSNPMRKAQYTIPKTGSDTDDGELTVSYFGPGQGGNIDANVTRWVGQFGEAKPSEGRRADRDVAGLRQHTVEVDSGTYSSGMPGGPTKPKTGWGLLGAIVEAPSGTYFFKLIGPSATVAKAKTDFYKLLDSVKPG